MKNNSSLPTINNTESGDSNNSNLRNLLVKLENFKNTVDNNDLNNEYISDTLSDITNKIINLLDNDELKYYKLTEEIAVTYSKLKNETSLDLLVLFNFFKAEITNSDYFLYQVSQNMVEADS